MNAIKHPRTAIFYGVMTGVVISVYTVWDKYAVDRLAVPPLVLEAFSALGISLMLTPAAARRWAEVKKIWRDHKTEVIGVAVLAPLSYILILTAMSFTPLSYVAPCREVSILFAVGLGRHETGRDCGTDCSIAVRHDSWESIVCHAVETHRFPEYRPFIPGAHPAFRES